MSSTVRRLCAAAALAAVTALPAVASADSIDTEAGYLRCDIEGSVSFIFGSSRDVTCTFDPVGDGPVQTYTGTIERYGIDIGYTESAVMLWGVLSTGQPVPAGGLAGSYAGVSAEVAAGYGVGANVLIFGEKSLALQPLSVQGGEGLNIAAGIAELKLEHN